MLKLERHVSGVWRVIEDGKPVAMEVWLVRSGVNLYPAIYRLLDAVARPEFSVPCQSPGFSKELNLDVQAEQARALHRVVRAMHDGHCPNCGYLAASDLFVKHISSGSERLTDHVCPHCGFTVSDAEAKEALAQFAPFLQKSVVLFKEWQSKRVRVEDAQDS
jgi:predicted RNA-binding Zn-ribbon protein involved in translation (DUF1610 family)